MLGTIASAKEQRREREARALEEKSKYCAFGLEFSVFTPLGLDDQMVPFVVSACDCRNTKKCGW